jgi:2-O-(6-phospho-alpha-D-mannosyl)-D-glycerate hydrolase
MEPATVYLVPHTHWDREWYEPFQRFRLRLVDLLDDVLARAEAEPDFRFTLDGQMAAVDDYLEVRPEAGERVRALVRRGQLAVGPWAILLDEFLCSGENIVRNLEWGLSRAHEMGGPMAVGYLPDMFGHCAQMPQILAGAGLRWACVWRGVPDAVARHAFVWQAPDGSAVRTEYLPGGYGNAAEMVTDPAGLDAAAAGHAVRMRPWYGGDPLLGMYGTDHSAPLPGLTAAVAAARGPLTVRLSTLAEYLALFDPADVAGLPVWRGELRSHARANILPGVLSNRPHLKRALSGAERMVERYAEPLAALWSEPRAWPARLLQLAWQRLVQSSCHDSVTGCGVDETAVQVAARIAEAEQIGRGVRDRALAGLAAAAPAGSVVAVNPSPRPRTAVVRLRLPVPADWAEVAVRLPDGTVVPAQPVAAADREGAVAGEAAPGAADALYTAVRPAADVAARLRKGSLGLDFLGRAVQRVEITEPHTLTVTVGLVGAGLTTAHRALADRVEAAGGMWAIRVPEEPWRDVYAAVPLPALGWSALCAQPAPTPTAGGRTPGTAGADGREPAEALPPAASHAVRAGPRMLASDLLEVAVGPDGALALRGADGTRLTGVGRIVDGGDVGDLYNYAPPPGDRLVDRPDQVRVRVLEYGPLVGSLRVDRTYPWGEVSMLVELRAGERFCRLDVAFDNRRTDHRVRLHVPLARPAQHSSAEGQFAVVARGRYAEGGHGEEPVPTYPAYGFVDAGGAAVLLDQVSEYELVDDGRELAITLLRAVGVISRADHPWRAEPAGPVIATPQAQCLGPVRTRLAVLPHAGDWSGARVPAAAEEFRCPPVTVRGTGPAGLAAAARAGLRVDGAGVAMTSLRRRDDEWLELRLVALIDAPTSARVSTVSAARRCDLLGRPGAELSPVDGVVTLPLRPWEIATIQLRQAVSAST